MFGMMQTQAACTKCGGEGTIIKNKCKECGGDGIVKGEELVEINIPAGVDNDMVVTVEGKGNQQAQWSLRKPTGNGKRRKER